MTIVSNFNIYSLHINIIIIYIYIVTDKYYVVPVISSTINNRCNCVLIIHNTLYYYIGVCNKLWKIERKKMFQGYIYTYYT